MASTAILAIKIISDARAAAKDLGQVESSAGKMQRGFERAAPAAKATIAGLAAVGVAAFKQASDLQQSTGAVESVFKRQAGSVKSLAKDAAGTVGLATSEYQSMASVLGASLGNLGVAQKDLVPTTDMLIRKGADLSATFGGSSKEAVEALGAALRGETDPLERYGISIKEATVQAELARRGQDKLTGAAGKAARTQALLALINKQSASSTGAFAREANTAAGAQQIMTANIKNAGAAIGTALLPVVAGLATKLSGLAGWIENNSGLVTKLALVAGTLAVGVLAVNAAFKVYSATSKVVGALSKAHAFWTNAETVAITRKTVATKISAAATKAMAVAQRILNLAMRANPIGLVITAIMLLVAGFVLAYKKSETFRNIVNAVMKAARTAIGWVVDKIGALIGWVKDKAPAAFNFLKEKVTLYFRLMTMPARLLIDWIGKLIGWVKDKAVAGFNILKEKAVSAFNAVIGPVKKAISWVQDLINKIQNIPGIPGGGGGGGSIFSRGWSMFSSNHSPGLRAGAGLTAAAGSSGFSRGAGGGGGNIVINVTGALDPDAVARQIERLLSDRRTRLGRA